MEEIEFYIDAAKETMEGAIKHLNIELSKIRAGKASVNMLDGLSLLKKDFSERLKKQFVILI